MAVLQQQQATLEASTNSAFVGLQEAIDNEKEYLRRSVQLLEQALERKDAEALQVRRYQIIHGWMQQYRPKVARLVKLEQSRYQDNKKQQRLQAKNTIVPFLETSRQLLAAVNAKAVLQALPNDVPANKAFVGEAVELEFAFKALEACGRKRWAIQYKQALVVEPLSA